MCSSLDRFLTSGHVMRGAVGSFADTLVAAPNSDDPGRTLFETLIVQICPKELVLEKVCSCVLAGQIRDAWTRMSPN